MNDSASTMQPITAQTAPRKPIPDTAPQPTVDERLETIGAALETALDPDATPKQRSDALVNVRDGRKTRATNGKQQG